MPNVMYSPSHRQAGVPTINIQLKLRISPDLPKNVSLQCYLITTVTHIQSVCSQMCVQVRIYFTA